MALKDQIHVYSVDTASFYNDNELKIHKKLSEIFLKRHELKEKIIKLIKINESMGVMEEDYHPRIKLYWDRLLALKYKRRLCNNEIASKKEELKELLEKNDKVRVLSPKATVEKNIVSIFMSTLIRTIGIEKDELTDEIIIVKTYYFNVLEDLINRGFFYKGEKYRVFTASAGQIRTKKTVFIKESTWNRYKNTLMCGLTIEDINSTKFQIAEEVAYGCNINKFLAYLALTNSATEVWKDFDIDRAIVVDDLEVIVNCEVDYINERDYTITRKRVDIPIEQTDGCGMICYRTYKKSMMCRLPWIKGLLTPMNFKQFIDEAKKKEKDTEKKKQISKVVDIYGKEWDIKKDNIDIIFTKSQFKMWKYYTNDYNEDGSVAKYGWDKYKEAYIKYKCQAGVCNVEPDADNFNRAKINYQMLQTLADISNEEIEKLCEQTNRSIKEVGNNKDLMMKLLGATEENEMKNGLQKAVLLYPELLRDEHCKRSLREVKKSYVKNARAGKLEVDGIYTFIIPDLYAFCEKLFLKINKPQGLLKNGEVYCKYYKGKEKLDCLRSPHLYREHAVRNNIVDKEKEKWFKTSGLYVSVNDPISKVLMCDWDGDMSLVCADETLIEVAERNMKDIVPLYYEMRTATVEKITNKNIYKGMTLAYTGGNIGIISNDITKVWNSDNIGNEAIEVVKLLCMENNFVID